MILKLPIVINNKVVNSLFKLKKYDNYFILSLLENNNISNNNLFNSDLLSSDKLLSNSIVDKNPTEISLIKILTCNNINGISYINLYFPLKLFIINKTILSIYFFTINLTSNFKNKLDFFYNLNNTLINKYNLSFINFNNYDEYQNDIFSIINKQYLFLINNKKFNKEFWEMINLLINCSGFILWLNNTNNIKNKLLKKILIISNSLKLIQYSINYSNAYNIGDHMKNSNNECLKLENINEDNSYFILINEKKYIYVKVLKIIDKSIYIDCFKDSIIFNKYSWFIYPPDTKINNTKIFLKLLNSQDTLKIIINKFNSKLNDNTINNIMNYFLKDHFKSYLYDFILENNENDINKTDEDIIISNSYTELFFLSICEKYKDNINNILGALFNNYIYPIKYYKKEIDTNFDYILYFSLINISKIIIVKDKYSLNSQINSMIPNKLKIIYFNVLKTFHQLINKKKNIIKNINDALQIQFFKIFFSTKSLTYQLLLSKIGIEEINYFKNSIVTTNILNDILLRLCWTNINKRLNYLQIIFNNKEELYFYDKINKNLFPDNFDARIKSIIINPFEMFKFLRKDSDFVKWIMFLENKCNELYFSNINLNSDDFDPLGRIVYNLINIKEQSFNDKNYKKLIYYGIKNPKLILDNFRINLKIKENFGYLKCNINLGILAKHLSQNKDNIIEFSDEQSEVTILKNDLKIITQKYLKYKKKYLNIIKE
jgi:hypothetical protein